MRLLAGLLLAFMLLATGGCETVGYYRQAVVGQWQLLAARQNSSQLLDDPRTEPGLRLKLAYVDRVLKFAETELDLPRKNRYTAYVQLDGPYVVWNVFAAPQTSLAGHEWCYPMVGCAPYRGFFKESDARALAQQMREQPVSDEGPTYETFVGGVAAYSTLGWFDDPLLSSFIEWPQANLASLLFHELTHARIWLKGDVRFNESLASFVAQQGLVQWQAREDLDLAQWYADEAQWRRMRSLLMALKMALVRSFSTTSDRALALTAKTRLYGAFEQCYELNRERLGGNRFDRLVNEQLNNAYLVSLGTYTDLQGFFAELFDLSGREWPRFWQQVSDWVEMDALDRDRALTEFVEQQKGNAADYDDTEQIQCEALARHGRDAEAST